MKEKKQDSKNPFQQLVKSRRSIRRYLEKPVEREKILTCIEAARLAPSAENVQPWRFLIIDDPDLKAQLAIDHVWPSDDEDGGMKGSEGVVGVSATTGWNESEAGAGVAE